MRTTILVLTVLSIVGDTGPFGQIANAADQAQSQGRRISSRPPVKGVTSLAMASVRKRDFKVLGSPAQPSIKEPRADFGRKSVSDWVVTQGAENVQQTRFGGNPVTSPPKAVQDVRPRISPRQKDAELNERSNAEAPALVMAVNLQRLVRYFQNGRPLAGEASASVSFRPPVNDKDASTILKPSAQAR